MKKRFKINIINILLIVLITILLITLSSCVKTNNNGLSVNNNGSQVDNDIIDSTTKDSKDKIQLWYYVDAENSAFSQYADRIADSAKEFCEANNIPLEIVKYDFNTLTLKDYIVKRNIAAVSGNMITIEQVANLFDIAKQHADYSKLNNYNNLLSGYKNRFCIPLGVDYRTRYINNEAMQYYSINFDKPLVSYIDYLNIKQDMKIKGATFELNRREFFQLIDYYMYKNDLLFLNEENDALNDSNKFKEKLNKIIRAVCDDILLYGNNNLVKALDPSVSNSQIYDINSGFILEEKSNSGHGNLVNHYLNRDDLLNKTLYIFPYNTTMSPNFYMYKKITNGKIYDLANHIVSEETYIYMSEMTFGDQITFVTDLTPVFKIEKAKEVLKLNDDLEFIGEDEINPKTREILNATYQILFKDEEKSREVSNAHFFNFDIYNKIKFFIYNRVHNIAEKLSGDELSLENFDSNNEEINKMLNEEIENYVTNFIIHNN